MDRLAEELSHGRMEPAADLFHAHGATTPTVIWRPSLLDVHHPVLRSFLRGCGGGGDRPVQEDWLDSEEFSALADWAMLLEEAPGGGDFIYRHYGAGIAESYGTDMTGQRVGDIGGYISTFFLALYQAAAARHDIVKSVHEPPRQVFVTAWRRLIVPLHDRDGSVRRFAVANVPDNPLRAGLDVLPDPVFIVSGEGMVCCANRAACLQFGGARRLAGTVSLSDWTGADIALPEDPDALIVAGENATREVQKGSGAGVVKLIANIGATYYRDTPFFVVALHTAP